jgi:hypothetical protein
MSAGWWAGQTVIGSPDHLDRHPRDLRDHLGIRYGFPSGRIFDRQFERGGEAIEIEVEGLLMHGHQELRSAPGSGA